MDMNSSADSSRSNSNSTLSVNPPAQQQHSQQPSKPGSLCSSFQTSASAPRDLLALKLSKVKATAALFESRSASTPPPLLTAQLRPASLDHPRRPSFRLHTPPTDQPALRLSAGHVSQIKNQFLSSPSLVDLQRRHSADRPASNRVLQNYAPE
ncbi:hypothetical protein PtA15_14A310 [Puccinia triticina]|uniref:Uncharacterized protein n=1 Tax=Puccinia triticina TaxID=208348 RepID=A0ABY7D1Z2_9BASI|nr:uncharacterized protein PtA15_14A310 [Puccinia triticina]WAQ91426.1 hypothetical protein PtA15_14A310 [Puccinia triticina]WAR62229.1 hypothetical protein PtB15_14B324 [Puccinia triticina]